MVECFICIYVPCTCSADGGHESHGLELEMAVNIPTGFEEQTQVPCKINNCSWLLGHICRPISTTYNSTSSE